MLKIIWLSDLGNKKKIWDEFDAESQVWIVSDLKSKSVLKKSLLKKRGYIKGEPILRASEYWAKLFESNFPDWKVLGPLGTSILLKEFIKKNGQSSWAHGPGAFKRVFRAINRLSLLITHPLCSQISSEFQDEFPEQTEFVELLNLSYEFYENLQKLKIVPWILVPNFLAQCHRPLSDDRTLIFDLGFEFRIGEREVVHRLCQQGAVSVLIPGQKSQDLQSQGLKCYDEFSVGVSSVEEIVLPPLKSNAEIHLWRCGSVFSEARLASDWISQLHRASPNRADISIVSVETEMARYVHPLANDLRWEGLRLNVGKPAKAAGLPLLRYINSLLRVAWDPIPPDCHLELVTLWDDLNPRARTKLKKMVGAVTQLHQIPESRLQKALVAFRADLKSGALNFFDFERIVLKATSQAPRGSKQETDSLIRIFESLRRDLGEFQLELPYWLEAFQMSSSQIDASLEKADPGGIEFHDLDSAEDTETSQLILLGMNQRRVSENFGLNLSDENFGFLAAQGFRIDSYDPARVLDAQVKWLLTGSYKSIVLSATVQDMGGRSTTPNRVWSEMALKLGKSQELLDNAGPIAWTHLQQNVTSLDWSANLDGWLGWREGRARLLSQRLCQEFGARDQKELVGAEILDGLSLSASKLETYHKCPFKFFATGLMKLNEDSDTTEDPAANRRGFWVHELLEKIMASQDLDIWTTEKISDLIDGIRDDYKIIVNDLWPLQKRKLGHLIKRFLEFERVWQAQHPKTKINHLEMPVQGFISVENEDVEFSVQPKDALSLPFRGVIDRVEENGSGKITIVDYKTSDLQIKNIASWNGGGSFQLSLYAKAIESGLSVAKGVSVESCQYFSLKTMSREKGFAVPSGESQFEGFSKRALLTQEQRDGFFKDIGKSVATSVAGIRRGDFEPNPNDQNICETCNWSDACRAKHLI